MKWMWFLICVPLYFGLEWACNKATGGFRFYALLSNLPNEPRFELSALEGKVVLDQPFTFLGSGGWCYAFLGADQTTVLKFYKHTHLTLGEVCRHPSWSALLLKSPTLSLDTPYFQAFNFTSCALLYTLAPKRTALLYAHLNKTSGHFKPVTLIDKLGIAHKIDLDQTEFVVQHRVEPVIPYLERLVKENKIEAAAASIDEMLQCLLELYTKGLRDQDTSFRANFGFVAHRAVTLDLSSFVYDETLKGQDYRALIRTKTKRLAHHLKKYHPQLYMHYEKSLENL